MLTQGFAELLYSYVEALPECISDAVITQGKKILAVKIN